MYFQQEEKENKLYFVNFDYDLWLYLSDLNHVKYETIKKCVYDIGEEGIPLNTEFFNEKIILKPGDILYWKEQLIAILKKENYDETYRTRDIIFAEWWVFDVKLLIEEITELKIISIENKEKTNFLELKTRKDSDSEILSSYSFHFSIKENKKIFYFCITKHAIENGKQYHYRKEYPIGLDFALNTQIIKALVAGWWSEECS